MLPPRVPTLSIFERRSEVGQGAISGPVFAIAAKSTKTGRSCLSAKMPGTANVRLNCGPEVLRALSSAKPWIWPTPSRKLTTRLVRRENFPFCLKNRVFQQNWRKPVIRCRCEETPANYVCLIARKRSLAALCCTETWFGCSGFP